MSDDLQRDPFESPSEGAEENPPHPVDGFAQEETPSGSVYAQLFDEPQPCGMDEGEVA